MQERRKGGALIFQQKPIVQSIIFRLLIGEKR